MGRAVVGFTLYLGIGLHVFLIYGNLAPMIIKLLIM